MELGSREQRSEGTTVARADGSRHHHQLYIGQGKGQSPHLHIPGPEPPCRARLDRGCRGTQRPLHGPESIGRAQGRGLRAGLPSQPHQLSEARDSQLPQGIKVTKSLPPQGWHPCHTRRHPSGQLEYSMVARQMKGRGVHTQETVRNPSKRSCTRPGRGCSTMWGPHPSIPPSPT